MKARGEYIPSKDGEDFAVLVNTADNTMISLSQLDAADPLAISKHPGQGEWRGFSDVAFLYKLDFSLNAIFLFQSAPYSFRGLVGVC